MISKILLPKSLVKKIALLLLTLQLVFVKKKLIIPLFCFLEIHHFLAENWQKRRKL
jgi:hypothetical protein